MHYWVTPLPKLVCISVYKHAGSHTVSTFFLRSYMSLLACNKATLIQRFFYIVITSLHQTRVSLRAKVQKDWEGTT